MTIDPLTLLIILFFVLGPLLNALFRRPDPSRRPPPRPQEARRTQTQAQLPREPRTEPSSDFERRLEEARRRVQDAMGESQAATRTQPSGQARSAPPQTRPAAVARDAEISSPSRSIEETETRRSQSPYARRTTTPYAMGQAMPNSLLSLDVSSLQKGIMWREILDQPLSRRRRSL